MLFIPTLPANAKFTTMVRMVGNTKNTKQIAMLAMMNNAKY